MIPESAPFQERPEDSECLVQLFQNVDFHAWLASVFLRFNKPSAWKLCTYKPQDSHPSARKPKEMANVAKQFVRKRLDQRLRCTYHHMPIAMELLFSLMLSLFKVSASFKGRNVKIHVPPRVKPDLLPLSALTALDTIVEKCMPNYFQDEFQRNLERNTSLSFRAGMGRLWTSNIYDDEMNVIKARASHNGEVVFSSQHGGGYGVHRVFTL